MFHRNPERNMWRNLLVAIFAAATLLAVDDYKLGPDSMPKEGVPKGRVEHFKFEDSKIYPGTTRDCWVYIPAQYDKSKPAALMVFQDGGAYVSTNGQMRVPVVFDNLIAAGEMPVTIALFINPGKRGDSSNRSFEYDSLGNDYVKFLLDEFLPFAKEKFDLNLNDDPEMRAICGMSSGAICAFTAAWERPDLFRKVLSQIGSFTNIRGGNIYPSLIRKTERKPIRVFLQDGVNDLNNLHGNWPLANQEMASALQFMGYDHRFVLGDGSHNGKHGGAILPDSLRWLWRKSSDLPKPLTKDNLAGDEALSKVLPEQGGWELVGEGYGFTDAACSDPTGNFYFSDLPKGIIYRAENGSKPKPWLEKGPKISGLKFGADGLLYAATQGSLNGQEKKQIISISPETKKIVTIATDVDPNDLIVSKAGWIYFTDTGKGEVVRVAASARSMSRAQTVAGGINKPNGITLSPDEKFLMVSEYGGTNAWSFMVAEDGTINSGERFMTLRQPAGAKDGVSGGDGMTRDNQGRVYITSLVGIQMFDATGRMGGVIAKPSNAACVSVGFAGEDQSWLYACASDKVFRRKTLAKGVALPLSSDGR
jgi:enterochelin esterase family protein